MSRCFTAASLSLLLLFAGSTANAQSFESAPQLSDAPTAVAGQTTSQNAPAAAAADQGTQTSPAANPAPPMTPEEQRRKAQEQLEQEEHQAHPGQETPAIGDDVLVAFVAHFPEPLEQIGEEMADCPGQRRAQV